MIPRSLVAIMKSKSIFALVLAAMLATVSCSKQEGPSILPPGDGTWKPPAIAVAQ